METLEEATPHLCYWGLLLGVIEILNVSQKVCHWNSSHQDPQYLTKGALSKFQAPPWGSPSLPELKYPHPCLQEVGVLALPLGATSCQLPLGAPLLAIMLATNRRHPCHAPWCKIFELALKLSFRQLVCKPREFVTQNAKLIESYFSRFKQVEVKSQ